MTTQRPAPTITAAILTLTLALAGLTHANEPSFRLFSYVLFDNLNAYAVDCAESGLPAGSFELSSCAVINDNYLELNRRIIERTVTDSGMTVEKPWHRNTDWYGEPLHQFAFYSQDGLLYALFYIEMSPTTSAVLLIAQRVNIGAAPAPPPPAPVPPTIKTESAGTAETLEAKAIAFVARYLHDWSLPNDEALARAADYYAANVDFYENAWTRDLVLHDKRATATRWPLRAYALDEASATASCTATSCTVVGELEWIARSPERDAESSGRSRIDVTLMMHSTGFAIVRETGSVIRRD